ncbi:hypothetical protein BLNAU_23556 [Blattamonas nauphoetae]|uniref:HTH CENPB-type domain-containing protein n=1 Tax=Blattamonas nauphoetae TaxID=2049346 RepID=A0ABQ9WPW2_9EUKA|nr:hypothetical protein BLNAU_23556 [Blattamonas nauphoetae]
MNVDVKAEIVRLFAEQEGHDGANRTEMICRFHSQHDFRAKDVIEALHIPRSTFYDGMKTLRKGYTPGKRGSHSKLRDAEDSLLKNWVDERCRAGRLPTPNDVTTQANSILIEHNQNENPPPQLSRSFGYNFLNRQPNVEIVTPTSFNIYHVCSCTKPFIRPWFDRLRQFLETVHIPPHLFFNMDETHLHTVAHLTPEVATTTPDIDAVVPLSPTIPGATIVFLVAADGDATLKSVILPTVNTPPDLVPFTTPTLSFYPIGQRHLNQETFKNYFLSQIIPAITNKRKISANPLTHALLLLDGAPYHKHAEVLRAAKDNLIDIPVDQSINATFRNVISQTIPDHLAVAAADHRQSFMQTFLRATDSALSHRSIQHSFSVCGLHPFNSQIGLSRVPDTIPDNVHLQPNQQHLLTPDLNSLFHPASDDLDDLFLPGRIPHA